MGEEQKHPKDLLPQSNVGDYILGYRSGYSAGYKDALIALKKENSITKMRSASVKRQYRTGEDYNKKIREQLDQNLHMTAAQLFKAVGGSPANFQRSLNALIEMKIVRFTGKGVRGDPKIYELYPEAKQQRIIRRTVQGERIETIKAGVPLSTMSEAACDGLSMDTGGRYHLMDIAKMGGGE